MKDVRIEIKVRNNLLLKKMEEGGFKTIAELSRACGIPQVQLGKLANMTDSPVANKKEGIGWRKSVLRLAEFFGCLPEDLFSETHVQNVLEKNRSFAEVSFAEIQSLLSASHEERLLPENAAVASELREKIAFALALIGKTYPKEAQVLILRFGLEDGIDRTLDEIGTIMGVSVERTRQLEARGLRKLRQPHFAHVLKQFFEDRPDDEDVRASRLLKSPS